MSAFNPGAGWHEATPEENAFNEGDSISAWDSDEAQWHYWVPDTPPLAEAIFNKINAIQKRAAGMGPQNVRADADEIIKTVALEVIATIAQEPWAREVDLTKLGIKYGIRAGSDR